MRAMDESVVETKLREMRVTGRSIGYLKKKILMEMKRFALADTVEKIIIKHQT